MTAKQFRHGGENLAVRTRWLIVSWAVAWWQKASGGLRDIAGR